MNDKPKAKWIRKSIWNGVQILWTIEGRKDIEILKDNRPSHMDKNYPYHLSINGRSHGFFRQLNVCKKDALILAEQEK